MEIDINQAKISIGDKYKIFIEGQQTHKASRQLFSLLPVVHLYDLGDDLVGQRSRKLVCR